MNKKVLFCWLGGFLFLLFFEWPGTKLFEPDEPRYAEIPSEMRASGNYVTPTLNGSVYLEKPPLLYWLNAFSFSLLGETSYAARLTVRLAGLFIVAMFLTMLGAIAGPQVGLWASLIYISSSLPFALHRINIIDGLLTASLTLVFLSLYRLLFFKPRFLFHFLLGMGLAASVLSKGLIGLVFPALSVGLWVVITRQWDKLKILILSPAWIVFLLLAFPWFWRVQQQNPEFFHFFFIREHFQRYTSRIHDRYEPFWFIFVTFLWGFFPWIFIFIHRIYKNGRSWLQNPIQLFFLSWGLVPLVFFSLSSSKLIPYILPAMPAAALLLAYSLAQQPPMKWVKGLLFGWALVLAIGIFLLPSISTRYSSDQMTAVAVQKNAEIIVGYQVFPRSVPWVLKRPIPIVDVFYKEELASVGEHDPLLFWDRPTFWQQWQSNRRICVIVNRKTVDAFFAEAPSSSYYEIEVTPAHHRYRLFSNFP